MHARTRNPKPMPKPAAFPVVPKKPPLLEAFAGAEVVVGGTDGVIVTTVTTPVTVITDVIGVGDQDGLEDEVCEVIGMTGGGGGGVLTVLDGVGVGLVVVDEGLVVVDEGLMVVVEGLRVDVALEVLEVKSGRGGGGLEGNEDPPGTKPGPDDGSCVWVEEVDGV